jgi:hypothetical protein
MGCRASGPVQCQVRRVGAGVADLRERLGVPGVGCATVDSTAGEPGTEKREPCHGGPVLPNSTGDVASGLPPHGGSPALPAG